MSERLVAAPVDMDRYAEFDPTSEAEVFVSDNGFKPDFEEYWVVITMDSTRDYSSNHVCKGRCLSKPFDEADAAADEITLWACSCEDYQWNRMADLHQGETPTEIGTCKHIEKVQRKTRSERELDDQQEALI